MPHSPDGTAFALWANAGPSGKYNYYMYNYSCCISNLCAWPLSLISTIHEWKNETSNVYLGGIPISPSQFLLCPPDVILIKIATEAFSVFKCQKQ